ncbi:hypothetical protein FRC07_003011 [Ceratobasidium sp. 392]|nr:hypothetical protein FRC07_003011 [Ceratobasidium sp. 392]
MYKALARQHLIRHTVPLGSTASRNISLSHIQKQEFRDATPAVFEQVVLKGGSKPVVVDFYAE